MDATKYDGLSNIAAKEEYIKLLTEMLSKDESLSEAERTELIAKHVQEVEEMHASISLSHSIEMDKALDKHREDIKEVLQNR